MNRDNEGVARRALLATAALGAAATGFAAPAAAATERTAAEAANVKLVEELLDSLTDFERMSEYLAADCLVRFDEKQAPMKELAEVYTALKTGVGDGKVSIDILGTSAAGPIVMHERVDTMTIPGKPDRVFRVVGVFLVRDGKIKEWTDYRNA